MISTTCITLSFAIMAVARAAGNEPSLFTVVNAYVLPAATIAGVILALRTRGYENSTAYWREETRKLQEEFAKQLKAK